MSYFLAETGKDEQEELKGMARRGTTGSKHPSHLLVTVCHSGDATGQYLPQGGDHTHHQARTPQL